MFSFLVYVWMCVDNVWPFKIIIIDFFLGCMIFLQISLCLCYLLCQIFIGVGLRWFRGVTNTGTVLC